MARYSHAVTGEAITKVDALIKNGATPIGAYKVVAADMKVPATTVARWYKNRSGVSNAKASSTKRVTPLKDRREEAVKALRTAAKDAGHRVEPTLADYAAEFESLNKDIPELSAKLDAMSDRKGELQKLIAEGLGL